MSGSFKVRGDLAEYDGDNCRRGKKETDIVSCLLKTATLLDANSGDLFFTHCVCQKIYCLCGRIRDVYEDDLPLVIANNQPPEKLVKAVMALISSDGRINAVKREELVEGLNAVLAMMGNG